MCERWVGDWTNCNILIPSSFVFSSTSFSFCWAALSGVLRAHNPLLGAGSLYSILSPTTDSKLTELPVAPGYIIVWSPPASCERRICTQFNPSTVKVIPWYLRPDAPVPWLTARSKVNVSQFPSFCWISVCSYVIISVTSCWDYYFFALFYVVLESLYWCIYVLPSRLGF